MSFEKLNSFGKRREPFLFISDFKGQDVKVFELQNIVDEDIEFCIDKNYKHKRHNDSLEKSSISFESYKKKFYKIQEHIKNGDTYLLNLTQPTNIKTNLSLKEIYNRANAHYKLRFKDKFVCFSPESFIQIKDDKINTYPMKGTINANIFNAKEKILSDKKEMAEHIMVVDLLRNDLSMVSKNVKVDDFRYIQKIDAGEIELLQVSSHISGELEDDWHSKIGSILKTLLPAGSISGTPKRKTLEIIEDTEGYNRGFFTGIFGVYDGYSLDSGVMIRFIEKKDNGYIYKSGGGITCDSDVIAEYQELSDKIYLP
ncbi:MAG: aminodeoxychorismate synthase component I [Campylobacterales bacterium]